MYISELINLIFDNRSPSSLSSTSRLQLQQSTFNMSYPNAYSKLCSYPRLTLEDFIQLEDLKESGKDYTTKVIFREALNVNEIHGMMPNSSFKTVADYLHEFKKGSSYFKPDLGEVKLNLKDQELPLSVDKVTKRMSEKHPTIISLEDYCTLFQLTSEEILAEQRAEIEARENEKREKKERKGTGLFTKAKLGLKNIFNKSVIGKIKSLACNLM